MARTNKYSSINFNEIYDKKFNPKSSSSSSSATSNPSSTKKTHGGMLVLTRPSPKPLPQIQPQTKPTSSSSSPSLPLQTQVVKPSSPDPDQTRGGSESISLRPLGRTGSSLSSSSSSSQSLLITQEKEREVSVPVSLSSSLKPEPFVPPHLRPGFVSREVKSGEDNSRQKNQGFRPREIGNRQGGQVGLLPSRYGEDGRPKSGGYERIQRSGESDLREMMNRPNSSGNHRPGSSGRYGSSYRSPHHF